GIAGWREDLRKVARSVDAAGPAGEMPFVDVDALLTRNPMFWQAYYEIAPGDPAAMCLQAALLLVGGEAKRAEYLAVIAAQRPGVPKAFRQALDDIRAHAKKVAREPNRLVEEGI